MLPYLQSKSWDTRTAAAKAIGGILSSAQSFDPNADDTGVKPDDIKEEQNGDSEPNDMALQFSNLDISLILQYGQKLLGGASKEYERALASLVPSDRLRWQKKSLTARLGLKEEVYTEDDLLAKFDLPHNPPAVPKVDTKSGHNQQSSATESPLTATSASANGTGLDESGLSKRQLNQLKRKNKFAQKTGPNKMRVV